MTLQNANAPGKRGIGGKANTSSAVILTSIAAKLQPAAYQFTLDGFAILGFALGLFLWGVL